MSFSLTLQNSLQVYILSNYLYFIDIIAISNETHLYAMLTTNLLSSYSRV